MPSSDPAAHRLELKRHPASPGDPAITIDVAAARPDATHLALTYGVTGRIGDLVIPPRAVPARTDELWRHTCFEAFVRASGGEAYVELNLSPSCEWAAYGFSGYRRDMAALDAVAAPRVDVEATSERLALSVLWDLSGAAELPRDATWRLGLSAVIDETGGRTSYWALAHPAGKPDFHHQAGFVYQLLHSEGP